MTLDGILAISGEPGLYKMVSQTKNGIIVESIETKKRIPAYASNKISSLEDIAIYTENDEVLLREVFQKIKDKTNGTQAVSHKASNNEIKDFFKTILPNYDEDRVYISDMKKVFRWYNILAENNLLIEDAQNKTEEIE
ncbi:MAG: DUF5606 domain-containing protein [Bacteroidales bacterium]|nr:DUF5606 domain-containing protein [Bacteroidales bacterium]